MRTSRKPWPVRWAQAAPVAALILTSATLARADHAKDDKSGETPVPTPETYAAGARASAQQVKSAVHQKVQQAAAVTTALTQPFSGMAKTTPTTQTAATPTKTGSRTSATASARAPKTTEERHLLNREVYVYKTVGRRDPFASLLEGEFETTVGNPLMDVSSMKLVGIVWGSSDKFALVEDGRGHGHVLRVGDPVINGYVVGLTKEELMVRQSSYGDTQTVTIQLQRKEGSPDE